MSRSLRLPGLTRALTAATAAALSLSLTACGGGSGGSDGGGKADPAAVQAALDKPAEITFWSWVPNIDKTIALFEKKYPKIKINLVNAGQSKDQYTKLTTALKAGKGAPDVAQIEYYALPQFAVSKSLVNLADYGAAGLKDKFAESAWTQVNVAGGIYGIPQDTGPMAMLYRKDILDRFGATPPATWEEYGTLAKKIHDADPNTFISFVDPGDAGATNSLIWQRGGKPYTVNGTTDVAINLKNDAGSKAYADTWGPLIENKLVESTVSWNDEWWKSMAAGRYATWLAGAWAPAVLEQFIPQSKGQWTVAPMPGGVSSENGGSSVAVTTQAKNKEASVAFAQWLNSDPEAVKSLNSEVGLFPATKLLLDNPGFRSAEVPFFPNSKPNEVFSDMSKAVRPGWQYLPFQPYANSVFKDSVGQALQPGGNLPGALATWEERLNGFGKEQGFTVK
ncbi:sugar ABC transporter substrate-binding protein [Streptomyces venezuelae]|uniref:Sugar ABC transporter substrate-binding protein n=1 Tax=Streptomyces venezuelae TaxID=54571 RepID=A0A5P2D8G2_STRVZ|nr:sugar ABC transporter substrate-binding protein [Streptomyces venezuelae]QES51395.1 sugar ABC transporter substrate-binding protein [Streptomyces venezuelae]